MGKYKVAKEEMEALAQIGKKYFDKTVKELIKEERVKIEPIDEVYRVTTLIITRKELQFIPEEINVFTQLQNLYLWSNEISEIRGLDNLTQLKYLRLEDNQISKIPLLLYSLALLPLFT